MAFGMCLITIVNFYDIVKLPVAITGGGLQIGYPVYIFMLNPYTYAFLSEKAQ